MRVVRVVGSWIVECCARFRSNVSKARSCISFVAFKEVRPAAAVFEDCRTGPSAEARDSVRLVFSGVVNGFDSELSAVPLEVDGGAVAVETGMPEAHFNSETGVDCSHALAA